MHVVSQVALVALYYYTRLCYTSFGAFWSSSISKACTDSSQGVGRENPRALARAPAQQAPKWTTNGASCKPFKNNLEETQGFPASPHTLLVQLDRSIGEARLEVHALVQLSNLAVSTPGPLPFCWLAWNPKQPERIRCFPKQPFPT